MVRTDPLTVNTSGLVQALFCSKAVELLYSVKYLVFYRIDMLKRNHSLIDRLIIEFDQILATACPREQVKAHRPSPADEIPENDLSRAERSHSGGLMRVNHAGEVSAQALYQGQALTSRSKQVRQTMWQSAKEEIDHLAWCAKRLDELGGHTSYLNPLWYLGSLTIGTLAGICGDKWSLGFVVETERQVVIHLQGHLEELPKQDLKSRAIVNQMVEDEARHGVTAMEVGGAELPAPIKKMMKISSRVMTRTAYWL